MPFSYSVVVAVSSFFFCIADFLSLRYQLAAELFISLTELVVVESTLSVMSQVLKVRADVSLTKAIYINSRLWLDLLNTVIESCFYSVYLFSLWISLQSATILLRFSVKVSYIIVTLLSLILSLNSAVHQLYYMICICIVRDCHDELSQNAF